jgi:hypothetical protein
MVPKFVLRHQSEMTGGVVKHDGGQPLTEVVSEVALRFGQA